MATLARKGSLTAVASVFKLANGQWGYIATTSAIDQQAVRQLLELAESIDHQL